MADSSYQVWSNNDTDQTAKDVKLTNNNDGTYSKNVQLTNKDYAGKQGMNTVTGETIVGQRTDFVNVMFQYNISTFDTILDETGTGNATHSNAVASINSGTGIGRCKLRSRDAVRYITGHEMNCEMTLDFQGGEAGLTQKAGIGDDDDGMAAWGYNGTTFGIWLRTVDGGLFHVAQSSWNRDKADGTGESGFNLNPLNENIYKVTYGWYGILPISFSVNAGSLLGWVQVHTFDIVNTSQNPHLGNPTLPLFIDVERLSGIGADISVRTSSWRGGIVGKQPPGTLADRTFLNVIREIQINGGNVVTPVITIRNLPNFQSRENHVKAKYGTVTISTAGTKDVFITIYVNAPLTGASFVDYDAINSACQFDITATAINIASINPIGGTIMAKTDKVRINLFSGDVVIPIYPGQDVSFCADSANSTVISVMLRHIEEF